MPIRGSERARYPSDWKRISADIRARAGHTCECTGECGSDHGGPSLTNPTGRCNAPNGKHVLREIGTALWVTWQECESGALETRYAGRRFAETAVKIVLTVAHLNHTPEDCRPENLKAMCQRCHLLLDKDEHARNARETRRAQKAIGELPGLESDAD